MAKNKDRIKMNTAAKEGQNNAKTKADPKKLLVVVCAIVVVVAISLFIDYSVKNPRIETSNDAFNRIAEAGVLYNNPEITYDTPIDAWESETTEMVDGKECWLVYIQINPNTPESKDFVYYVEQKNGKIYTLDDNGKLIPYAA